MDQVPAPARFVVPARQYVLNIGGALGDSLCVSAYYLQRTLASENYNLVKDSPSFSENVFNFLSLVGFHQLVTITLLQIQIIQNEGVFLNLEWL